MTGPAHLTVEEWQARIDVLISAGPVYTAELLADCALLLEVWSGQPPAVVHEEIDRVNAARPRDVAGAILVRLDERGAPHPIQIGE